MKTEARGNRGVVPALSFLGGKLRGDQMIPCGREDPPFFTKFRGGNIGPGRGEDNGRGRK